MKMNIMINRVKLEPKEDIFIRKQGNAYNLHKSEINSKI